MPKYWVKNYFAHGRFPEVGQKQKTEEEKKRLNDGENNGQATHGARKHAWRTQAAWANNNNNIITKLIISSITSLFILFSSWIHRFGENLFC